MRVFVRIKVPKHKLMFISGAVADVMDDFMVCSCSSSSSRSWSATAGSPQATRRKHGDVDKVKEFSNWFLIRKDFIPVFRYQETIYGTSIKTSLS